MRILLAGLAGLVLAGFTLPAAASGFPVTIDNCGTPVTFDRAPQRAVSNDVNITETLIALGVQGQMAGYTGISGWNKLTPELLEQLGHLKQLAEKYPSLEVLLGAKTDFFVAGWNYGMRVGGEVTPETLAPFGIKTYAIRESCIHLGPRADVGIDDMIQDTLALGRAFGVAERAEALVEGFRQRLAEITAKTARAPAPLRVFVYDSEEDAPFTAGRYAMPTALIAAAGARNVMDDVASSWTKVNWEPVIARDPQVIVIIDYGDVTADQKIAFLTHAPALAGISAVRDRRFVVLPYDAATPGVRNVQAVEDLARGFYPDLFR